ncbi:helix-turn-helix transcriptional regulator [Xanthocytophaga agilis]|uniref:Helix-turn-helix transcriptional regulator n=1 Tax=Xanthocytophaga agilis TaxID=3048010 RepID=A0AAE3UDW5_9BACT|nr:helix-turn-helix transcriptional regulator [Xanthocytophaga agilis]MDJ1501630.1 helix-turn-helix transcriptional regulator [Xanthocytophaga agilis]
MKSDKSPVIINSIFELHSLLELPKPLHPLVSVFDNTKVVTNKKKLPKAFIFDFYNISYKKQLKGRSGYGQNYYDFDDGTMIFTSPKQLITTLDEREYFGITLLFHPDFIRHHPLGLNIRQYGFFSYESNEALHLSDSEKQTVLSVFKNIEDELHHNIDDFSQDIILSHIEALLNYSNRFYKRQFITRKTVNHDMLTRVEKVLNEYLDTENAIVDGLPTVEMLASKVSVSPRYLSDMLRSVTGQNAQQLIHEKLIEKAKEYLSATSMSISEIAYHLGFEYPQSFSKLFKRKTGVTPVEFKEGFRLN